MVAALILIHVAYVSISLMSLPVMCFSVNNLDIVQVYHMILTAHMILDFRFVANACRRLFSALANAPIILSTSL